MKTGSWLLAMAGAGVFTMGTAPTARADDDACIAASENEIPLRKAGKLQDALGQLSLCVARTCPPQIVAECTRRIREVNAIQPTLVLAATDAATNDLSAVTVTFDGLPFASMLDGRAVPVDPGTHVLHAVAPGMAPVDKTLVVREGEKGRRVNVVFQSGATSAPYVPSAINQAAEAHKTYAEISWAVGGIGLIVGAIAGIVALEEGAIAPAEADLGQTTSNTGATVVAITGVSIAVAGGVTGTVLWFTAPQRVVVPTAIQWTVVPMIGTGTTGLMVAGTF